ncbi:MAG: hypothetical protein A2Y00_01455 [Omnitrophica WOR_2 bacterium GWF2_43_52]|nr:MAG: hypothetical protein A2Y01_05405 [Omnitrophica WOR_2 bacterium GWC2_44_8]OGX20025.1 MAG: hypothetical protein A2Y00_01455 [Omnitrophica WOR_2 bacterium GWF2_43_52]OGX54627.1 MAG: hypothetical protein A2460_09400 [Omnitrophica WOR_2 bacterium RIFOXYC2_FULL_43_9]HAH19629.1 hypothetical protein [Candidatus Omnitrophota bacterium]HBG64118.1 hypothetical protein [Candidatus Omnitrophota bacterium]
MKDEMDILREVGSIAAAHGGMALSEILGKKITLLMPSIDMVSCNNISKKLGAKETGITVVCRIFTGLKGESAFILDERNAFKLLGLSPSVSDVDKKSELITEMGMSTIKEIGSIVINAYLSAISVILKRVILSLPPTLISGTISEIINIIIASSGVDDYALLIEAVFEEPEQKIKGSFYLLLSQKAAADIRAACEQMLEDLKKQ